MSVGERGASVLRPGGTLHVFGGDGPEQTFDTVQCCHCGKHWVYRPGSGKRRGWCTKCGRVTCGDAMCDPCVPIEVRLENREAGRDLYHRQIVVPVGIDL